MPRVAQFDDYDTPEQKRHCYNCQYPDCIVPDKTTKHCTAFEPWELEDFARKWRKRNKKGR
jgi:hypothetical protein